MVFLVGICDPGFGESAHPDAIQTPKGMARWSLGSFTGNKALYPMGSGPTIVNGQPEKLPLFGIGGMKKNPTIPGWDKMQDYYTQNREGLLYFAWSTPKWKEKVEQYMEKQKARMDKEDLKVVFLPQTEMRDLIADYRSSFPASSRPNKPKNMPYRSPFQYQNPAPLAEQVEALQRNKEAESEPVKTAVHDDNSTHP